jgi:D-alanine-D-alanine ligase
MARRCTVYTAVVAGEEEDPENATAAIANTLCVALNGLGWIAEHRKLDGDLRLVLEDLRADPPDFVFNMVEGFLGTDRLAFIGTGIYETAGVPFAGTGTFGLMAGTDKLVCKRMLRSEGVPTPGFTEGPDWSGVDEDRLYIVKAIGEHASLGLDQGAVVQGREAIMARAAAYEAQHKSKVFAEAFITGREFNVGMVELADGPRVMPLAEMDFTGFPNDMHRIVDYSAKWREDTIQYQCSNRRFIDEAAEADLAAKLKSNALKVWKLFDLCGWARIDFRIDKDGNPFVIDVNVNPDISEEAGLAAAALQAGITYPQLLETIIAAGMRRVRV